MCLTLRRSLAGTAHTGPGTTRPAVFSFLYLKKIKFQKYMSVFKYFKNIPRSPCHRATGPMYNFFSFKFATKSLEKKKGGLSPPPTGDRGLSPTPRATGPCRPLGGRQAPLFFPGSFIFSGTYFELFERVFVIIVGKISAANSYHT